MSDDYIQTFYVYQNGDAEELVAEHRRSFEAHDTLDWDGAFLRTAVGNVRITPAEVPSITNMGALENYTVESETEDLDLLYAPLVKHFLGEEQYFEGGPDHPFGAAEGEPVEQFAEMVATGYEATDDPPLAACAVTPRERAAINAGHTPFTAESLSRSEYAFLSWITVFTPPMVETYGRETLLSAPAWETRELADGAVLIVAYGDPHNPDRDQHVAAARHIGLESYYDR